MVATMASYLDQLEVSVRPGTVADAELALRFFAHQVTEADPTCVSVAAIGRPHIEGFKRWLVARRGNTGKPLATMTIRHRLSTVRTFFERIMEWDYDDAPARLFIYMSDFPALDEPLPKFLDDPMAAKFMAALARGPQPAPSSHGRVVGPHRDTRRRARRALRRRHDPQRRRSIVCASPSASCTTIATCRCTRCWSISSVEYRAMRGPSRSSHLLERDDGRPFDRRTIHRYVATIAKRAGVGHVHPHQLRHTLATQSGRGQIAGHDGRAWPRNGTQPPLRQAWRPWELFGGCEET